MPTSAIRSAIRFATSAMVFAAIAGACGAGFPAAVPTGDWGGQHAGMVVTTAGADLEFDCAAGRISAPLTLDGHGDFNLPGAFIRMGPGPIPADTSTIPKLVARFTGHTNGRTMALTMTVEDGSVPEQTFSLVYGGNPRVYKCV